MKLLLAVLALISAGPAAADCPKAADWARAFYSEHYSFYAGAPDPILQFTTPEFGALLKKEWAYSKGEVGRMDYDPWLGAQDGEIGKPVRFSVESDAAITSWTRCISKNENHENVLIHRHYLLCRKSLPSASGRGNQISITR